MQIKGEMLLGLVYFLFWKLFYTENFCVWNATGSSADMERFEMQSNALK